MNTPQTYYTLEMIRQQRLDKKAEILQSKQRMYQLAHQLFNPPQSKNKFEGMMQHVNMGIAAYALSSEVKNENNLFYIINMYMKLKHLFTTLFFLCCTLAITAQTDSTFYIKGSMGRLAAHLQLPGLKAGEKCPMVIICHGFTGNQDEPLLRAIADNLVKNGIGTMRFDFNAHGKSEGDFINMTVPNEIDDALSVIAFVRNLPQTANISLLGHSQGGVVSAMTAGQLGKDVIKSVVLMAPAAVLRDDALRGNTMGAMYDPWHAPEFVTMPSGHKLGRNFIQTAVTLPIYETAQKYEGPALILHGMDDRIVPYTYGERFHYVMKHSEIILIPGENHGFGANLPYAATTASGWLTDRLK